MESPSTLFAISTPPSLNIFFILAALGDVVVFAYAGRVFHRMASVEDGVPWRVKRFVLDVWVALFVHITFLLLSVDAFQLKSGGPDANNVADLFPLTVAAGLASVASLFHVFRIPLSTWVYFYTLHTGDIFRSATSPCDFINVTQAMLNAWSLLLAAIPVAASFSFAAQYPDPHPVSSALYAVVAIGVTGVLVQLGLVLLLKSRIRSSPNTSSTTTTAPTTATTTTTTTTASTTNNNGRATQSLAGLRLAPFSEALLGLPLLATGELVLWIVWAAISRAVYPYRPTILLSAEGLGSPRGESPKPFLIDSIQLLFTLGTAIRTPVVLGLVLKRFSAAAAAQKAFNAGTALPIVSQRRHYEDSYDMGGGRTGLALPGDSYTTESYSYS